MKHVIFIVGPTASGKTEISLHVAKQLCGDIISSDSMQIYKDLTIGTAKVNYAAYPEIPHHMIDIIPPAEEFSVYQFRESALACIKQIHDKGGLPFIVGGSGLYIKALTDGIADHPGCDNNIRDRLHCEIKDKGISVVYKRLVELDPGAAEGINENDIRRIVRALEIYEQSGMTPSEWKKKTISLDTLGYKFLLVGIMRDRNELYARVNERVDAMMQAGLLEEVKNLNGKHLSKTTRQAVGYKELLAHLQGEISLQDAISLIKQNTRHLVKKQLTWFRKEGRIAWFTIGQNSNEEMVSAELVNHIKDWIKNNK
ncbi:tRNA (adenosine(37)-N6)-dimethylallyltransferase MiaA [Candidatus Omnitrophota bacterium]